MDEEKTIPDEIRKYVSNTDRDIYTVSNIPEEVIAVIFAYVSRSPKSFRENIMTVIEEEQLGRDRAAKFHEKWVLNYGHASVAEHAAVHIGVERVSRLFSSVLELSNEYLSFTEYSQRYQKPLKGDFHVPGELNNHDSLRKEFIELNNLQYDIYEQLNDRLLEYLKDAVPVPEGKSDKAHMRALEKVAFEDARYALNLSTLTNLGMTGNARAIEDCLSKLLSSSYAEVRNRANEIKNEVKFSVPTLVKYADENKYITDTRMALTELTRDLLPMDGIYNSDKSYEVNLLNWTGKGMPDCQTFAIEKILNAMLFEQSRKTLGEVSAVVEDLSVSQKLKIFKKSLENLGKYDNPSNPLKLIKYEAEFVISEANWHQLLRHRKTDWIYQEPGIQNGITIPPHVSGAGAGDLLGKSVSLSEELYHKLLDNKLQQAASYVVTNAHNRRIIGSFDLWELYHLINLRMSEGAQWDIKNIIRILAGKIEEHHPALLAPALGRVEEKT